MWHVLRLIGWLLLLGAGCSDGSAPDRMENEDGAAGAGMPDTTAGSGGQGGSETPQPPEAGEGGSQTNGGGATDAGQPTDAGGDASVPDAGVLSEPRGTGPGDWGPGDYPPDLMAQDYLEISGVPGQDGNVRQYKVHVPPSYEPDTPTPAVFCIHGLGQNAVMFCVNGTEMHTKADEAGFILIMPNGYENSWNGGTCCGGASTAGLDDVALFRAILDEVGTHVNIDLDRVYATGLSNGGFMSYRLACEAADILAAVAPGAGALGINTIGGGTNPESDFTACEPSRPVSLLAINGTADGLVSYSSVEPSMTHMAAQYGCATETMPANDLPNGGDTSCVRYSDCPTGTELASCTIEGGGHCWFGTPDCGTGGGAIGSIVVGADSDTMVNNDAIWTFFERVSR